MLGQVASHPKENWWLLEPPRARAAMSGGAPDGQSHTHAPPLDRPEDPKRARVVEFTRAGCPP